MTEQVSASEVGLYARKTAVYRLYDNEERLLYVGVTCDLAVRWAAHRLEKPWWSEVARREVAWRENRTAALREEAGAIELEKPLHNVSGTPRFAEISRQRHSFGLSCRQNPDRHDKPGVLARPTPEIRDAAKQALAEQPGDWTMNDFLVACMVLLAKNPKAMLERLAEFRPEQKKGRPPKKRDQPPT